MDQIQRFAPDRGDVAKGRRLPFQQRFREQPESPGHRTLGAAPEHVMSAQSGGSRPHAASCPTRVQPTRHSQEELSVPHLAREHGVGGVPGLLPDLEGRDVRLSRSLRSRRSGHA